MNQRKEMQRRRKLLVPWIKKLRKVCHHKSCKNINACPRMHNKCMPHLALDTAIAWEAANYLSYFSGYHHHVVNETPEFSSKKIYHTIYVYWDAIDTHSSSITCYQRENYRIELIVHTLDSIIDLIQKNFEWE